MQIIMVTPMFHLRWNFDPFWIIPRVLDSFNQYHPKLKFLPECKGNIKKGEKKKDEAIMYNLTPINIVDC